MNKNRFIKNNKSKNNKTRKNKKNKKNYYKKTQKTIIRNKKGGSRNPPSMYNIFLVNRKIKNTKKLIGGGYVGIRLFINDEKPITLGEIQPTESIESILRSYGREGEINELYINRKFISIFISYS